MNSIDKQDPKTFTDFLRRIFKRVLDSIAGLLNKLGIRPNMVTAAGLIGNLVAAVLVAFGYLTWGGIIAMLVGPLDALDGSLARLRKESGRYGAFVDAVTDRYSEIVLYAGILIYFNKIGAWQDTLLLFIASIGSIMVSYIRARAEALDFSAKIGILTRAERYLVLIPGIIFGYLRLSLWILAVLTNLTAIQRIIYVRKQAKKFPHIME